MDWHTNSMPLCEEPDTNECRNFIQNLNGTECPELNQYAYNGSFNDFDRLSFQVQIEKEEMPFTVTNLNTVHIGVFTYQPKHYDWITSTANLKSKCKDGREYLLDKDN